MAYRRWTYERLGQPKRLAQCVNGTTTSSFTYGADGICRRTVVQTGQGTPVTTDSVLDNSMMVREMRGGTPYATYLTGPRGPECRRDDTTGQVRWYIYDGLGSVVGEIDPAGNMTTTRSHDVYGLVRSSTGQRTSAHGFVGSLGHTSEDNTGLVYMGARYMDPVIGRFMSEDPGRAGRNLFVYCGDNPVNFVDANGKIYSPPFMLMFVLTGILMGLASIPGPLQLVWCALLVIVTLLDIYLTFKFMSDKANGLGDNIKRQLEGSGVSLTTPQLDSINVSISEMKNATGAGSNMSKTAGAEIEQFIWLGLCDG